ncbi:putative response regulator receiver domain protein (CheY-like) [Bradyrhizobium sp. ORS 285]|uniref:ATP-binding response regulator n=1 Tax=Bradyrhizobium sp. ORS 285 TaxID=115808 RepID=UPI0002406DA1|nr:response regulator [Bradyrhizobium sp. ORS 285]CCD87874.1 putative response regulator receiver domain protein (CheY-like) [Bradyrhizobium sp. ORS 285]SMX61040.1 putative response regulator receiver domain protein (CheY-like) [Bradyrhizobium sp. ORS 285]
MPNSVGSKDVDRTRILIVDDDSFSLSFLEQLLSSLGYLVETSSDGAEAFAMLRENPARADLVITDRIMPVMDGLALTRRLKREPSTRAMPVILLTGSNIAEDVAAGLDAGAFYYLTKPPSIELVKSVVESAKKEVDRQRNVSSRLAVHQAAFGNVVVMRMSLSRPHEVEGVCSLLASLHSEPEAIIQGIYELVQNAVEHGVLRFGLQNKAALLAAGRWQSELDSRGRSPALRGEVEATMMRKDGHLVLSVKDTGPGFDWRPFLSTDPSRALAPNGRGIARANNYTFSKLVYNEAGNEVVGVIQAKRPAEW